MSGNKSKTEAIQESDIVGLKYFDQLAPLLERLHHDGCERDTAGNRTLHYDEYCMLLLLYMFNPVVSSLRGIQQSSELKGAPGDTHQPEAIPASLTPLVFERFLPSLTLWLSPNCCPKLLPHDFASALRWVIHRFRPMRLVDQRALGVCSNSFGQLNRCRARDTLYELNTKRVASKSRLSEKNQFGR